MANAKANDNGLPNQLLKMNIKPIKLIKTIWPACIFAYKRINNANGFMNNPNNSIGTKIMYKGILPYQGNESPNGLNWCIQ